MAEQESWIERRQRRVRCKAHGLHYDPRISSGCVLCVKAWSKLVPRRAPQFTIVLLCVLGMAAALYQVFGPGQAVGGPLIVEQETAPDPKLDPGPYRQAIETLEASLFAPVEDRRDLATAANSFAAAAQDLSDRIQRLGSSRADTADAIAALGASTSDAFGFAELERLRVDWLRLRRHRFRSAPWFLAPVAEGSARDRILLAEYRELVRSLQALIYEGAAEAQAVADLEDPAAGEDHWREFASAWRQRLDELWRGRPQRPSAAADDDLLVAIQELEQAFQSARALASDPGLVSGGDSGIRFEKVVEQAASAERAFDNVRL